MTCVPGILTPILLFVCLPKTVLSTEHSLLLSIIEKTPMQRFIRSINCQDISTDKQISFVLALLDDFCSFFWPEACAVCVFSLSWFLSWMCVTMLFVRLNL